MRINALNRKLLVEIVSGDFFPNAFQCSEAGSSA
jgi:hypothetical protein